MTTKVTVKTHCWPVAVTVSDQCSHHGDQAYGHSYSSNTEFVPKESEREFHVTDCLTFTVAELPEDAEGLPNNQPTPAG